VLRKALANTTTTKARIKDAQNRWAESISWKQAPVQMMVTAKTRRRSKFSRLEFSTVFKTTDHLK
jgi:hypothetical protein